MKGMTQCVPCCEAVYSLSDSEVLGGKLAQRDELSSLDGEGQSSNCRLPISSPSPCNDVEALGSGSESQSNMPKTRLHRRHRRFLALLDLEINNEMFPVSLEALMLPCAYELELPAALIARQARRFNEAVELRFTFHVRHCSLKARNLTLLLRCPWGTEHYLGPLASQGPVTSARFVSEVPSTVTLVVEENACLPPEVDAPLPCEMLLKEHVKTILENDDFCGSVAAPHVQNLVRELPFYESAMRRFRTWSEFVIRFADFFGSWEALQYDEDEHVALGLSNLTPPGELRLVANCYADRYVVADVHRDRIKWRALCDFRERVEEHCGSDGVSAVALSRSGELTIRLPRQTMRTLSSEISFRTLNNVNYLHLLEQLAETRFVLFSEMHPIQADVCLLPNTSDEFLLSVGSR